MEHRAIILDFFGVMCSEISPIWLRRYFSSEESEFLKSGLVREADLGTISDEGLFESLGKAAHISAKQVEDEWWELVNINSELIDLLPSFSSRYQLGLLTNAPSRFFHRILRTYDITNFFKVVMVSSEIGVAKPDALAYERALAGMGLQAAATVMVDDTPHNVLGARAVGMAAVLYTSAADLSERFLP